MEIRYNSLDTLPIYNYVQAANGHFQYLFKSDIDTLTEPHDKDKEELSLHFQDMCNRYEGTRDIMKVRIIEEMNIVGQMEMLNKILLNSVFRDKENEAELLKQLSYYGMKLNYNVNLNKIARLIRKIDEKVKSEEGETFSLSALRSSIIATNKILGYDAVSLMTPTSIYFESQESIKKIIANG